MHLNDTLPSTCDTGLLAAEVQVAFPVFLFNNHYFYYITGLQSMKVPEFVQRNKTITFETNVDHHVGFGKAHYGTLNHFTISDLFECALINGIILELLLVVVTGNVALVNAPIEIIVCGDC